MPAAGILGAQFVEQFGGVHVGSPFKPSAHEWPDECERMLSLYVPSGKCLSLDNPQPADLPLRTCAKTNSDFVEAGECSSTEAAPGVCAGAAGAFAHRRS